MCVALSAILTAALARLLAAAPEPQAAQIARGMMQAMGGEAVWKQARYVRFDFTLKLHNQIKFDRAHLWDKQTGRYRLEDKSTTGRFAVVLFNLGDQQGAAYVDGKKLEGAGGRLGCKRRPPRLPHRRQLARPAVELALARLPSQVRGREEPEGPGVRSGGGDGRRVCRGAGHAL